MKCNICHKELYSSVGKGCKLCAMPLKDKSQEFCCKPCRKDYAKVIGR
ncbi:hypothetical protein HOD38_02315 [archaeon]|nr:hypothetical protein [archaeon]MBT4397076.1 hypothetical protein [archaeon]MBT4441197.1 hypothetical protein [archaeon]